MKTARPDANGHRRRVVRARVIAEETHCALCDKPVDKTLSTQAGVHGRVCPKRDCGGCMPHARRGEVDEDLPRSRGGSPYDRANCRLMHRECNRWKNTMTLAEARAKLHGTTAPAKPTISSPIW
jgi:5-methylcytosine-specific restriction endonuclease McrA